MIQKNENSNVLEGYFSRKRKGIIISILLVIIIIALAVTMMLVGNTFYSPGTVVKILMGQELEGAFAIHTIRLPRMFGAILAGGAFGMSGYIFQTLLRNSLASPDIIGVSAGSTTFAVFAILVLGLQGTAVSMISVIAGILIALGIYLLSRKNGHFSNGRMILVGIGVQAFTKAITNFILTRAAEFDVQSTMRWMSGSLNNVRMSDVKVLAVVVILAGFILWCFSSHLQILQLGEEYPVTLGVNVKLINIILILGGVILVAFSTSVTGPIASVAFLSAPIATRIIGKDRCGLIPSALVGIILVQASDLIGQNLLPARYPVGVVTGLLGAPYLIYLLICMNKKGESVS